MISLLKAVSTLDGLAESFFGWDLQQAYYENSQGVKCYFYTQTLASQIPVIGGIVQPITSTFENVAGALGLGKDLNEYLFNTFMTQDNISGSFKRKGGRVSIPFQNYDMLVNSGITGQTIKMSCIISGTQYLKGYYNLVSTCFNNTDSGIGSLMHPVYGLIKTAMPTEINEVFRSSALNTVMFTITFETADISYLNPSLLKTSKLQMAAEAFMIAQQAMFAVFQTITNVKGVISTVKGLTSAKSKLLIGDYGKNNLGANINYSPNAYVLYQDIVSQLTNIYTTYQNMLAFFYKRISQDVFQEPSLDTFNINWDYLLPSSISQFNINSNQVSVQMNSYNQLCDTLIEFINVQVGTQTNLQLQKIQGTLESSINAINQFAEALLNYQQNNLIIYKTKYPCSLMRIMFENKIPIDSYQAQVKLNSQIQSLNYIPKGVEIVLTQDF